MSAKRFSVDVLLEIASYLHSTEFLSVVCRRFWAALRNHHAVVTTVTHGRVLRHQLVWLRNEIKRSARGIERLTLRYGVHSAVDHSEALIDALTGKNKIRALTLFF